MLGQEHVLDIYNELSIRFIEKYFVQQESMEIKMINYTENVTYLVTMPNARYILRITSVGYHTKEELAAELLFLESVNSKGEVNVPQVLRGLDREAVQELFCAAFDAVVYGMLFTYVPGEIPNNEDENQLLHYYEKLGEITALLHQHTEGIPSLSTLNRPVWDFDTTIGDKVNWGKWQDGLGLTPETSGLFQRTADVIKERLQLFSREDKRIGLIHGDLRLSNVLVDNEDLYVIDFDDCGFSWYLYDLGCALSFIEHKSYVPRLVDMWVTGYRKVRPLTPEEIEEIPTFIMLRRLVLVGWVGSRRDRELAQQLGEQYTEQTVEMAKRYIETHGHKQLVL